jgi:GntR family transcriptional regulator/MocR family aminotransferase
MRIPLDRQSGEPLYRQLEAYLRQQIRSGGLPAETRLPATRQLAADLGVSRITVKNAYAALESDGLIGTREGSGTFVMPAPPQPAHPAGGADQRWPLWQLPFQAEQNDDRDVRPEPDGGSGDLIAFTGVGDPREFPVRDLLKAVQLVVRRDGVAALEYGDFTSGHAPLRATIAQVLASQGIQTHPEQVLVTSGSQQALALVCQTLLRPGDVVLVESPTYNLALELFQSLGLTAVGVPIDQHGMQTALLERALQQQHPRLIYTIPNFQNPSGVCLSAARRRELVELAQRYNVPVLEDDFVGDLRYHGRALPAVKALDPGGLVIYTGSFSKMLMPGLRVGYLLADGPVFARLVRQKRVSDLTTSTLMQRALDVFVTVGRYQAHLRRSCRLYSQRRDAMLAALRRHLPADAEAEPPLGGLFLWLRLPERLSSLELLPLAAQEGVTFASGDRFFPDPAEGRRFLRLNFAVRTPAEIDEGVRRLGRAVRRLAGRRG